MRKDWGCAARRGIHPTPEIMPVPPAFRSARSARRLPAVIGLLLLAGGCGPAEPGPWVEGDGYRWRELGGTVGAGPGFTAMVPSRTGVDFSNRVDARRRLENQLLTHGAG